MDNDFKEMKKQFNQDCLDSLSWTTIPDDQSNKYSTPLQVAFDHPMFFMICRTNNTNGLGLSRQESVGLLRLLAARLPLDALGAV